MKQPFCLLFFFLLIAFPAAAALPPIVLPLRTGEIHSGDVLNAAIPWNEDFFDLGTEAPAAVKTRFKAFHDNYSLYLGILAEEPDVAGMYRKQYPADRDFAWRNDSIDLNFCITGHPETYFQIVVTPDGLVDDVQCEDDNTGTTTYVRDASWTSGVQFLSKSVEEKCWKIELRIPLGNFFSGDRGASTDLSLILGRTRWKDGRYTCSANIQTKKSVFLDPQQFRELKLENFAAAPFAWQVEIPQVKCRKNADGLVAQSLNSVINRSPERASFKLKTELFHQKSKQLFSQIKISQGHPNKIAQLVTDIPIRDSGGYNLRITLMDPKDHPLCQKNLPIVLDYQTTKIILQEPCYRNNIYATQKISEIKAQILLEEGIGKPLAVTLTGPDTNLQQTLPAAQASNVVAFPAGRLADGTYTLSANGVSLPIRKLPYREGEVWFDKDGIPYVDGKPFLGIGYYGYSPAKKWQGINVMQSYVFKFKEPKEFLQALDAAHAAGIKAIYPISQEFNGTWTLNEFHYEQRKGSVLSPKQRELLIQFAQIAQQHPAFFGYYAADEPEGNGFNPEWQEAVRKCLTDADPYHPVIITNYGMEGMRKFATGCDMLMPDCYPNYFLDNTTEKPRHVSYEFSQLALALSCSSWLVPQAFDFARVSATGSPGRAPTMDEFRQQIYLGFLGNAKGILPYSLAYRAYFNYGLRHSLEEIPKEISAIGNVLLGPTQHQEIKADQPETSLITGVKHCGDQWVIIAVSISDKPLQNVTFKTTFELPPKLALSGEKRAVSTQKTEFTDSFLPHETHLYLSPDIPSADLDWNAIREKIRRDESLRKKPGNLLAAGELTYNQQREYRKGNLPAGIPFIKASSTLDQEPYSCYSPYYLQDGIIEANPQDITMSWCPHFQDQERYVDMVFPNAVTISKFVIYSTEHKGVSTLQACHLVNQENNQILAALTENTALQSTLTFPAVTTRHIRLYIDKMTYGPFRQLLTELEVYGANP